MAGAGPIFSSTDFVTEGFRRVDGIYAAGRKAKLSTRQIKTALRVAAVPSEVAVLQSDPSLIFFEKEHRPTRSQERARMGAHT